MNMYNYTRSGKFAINYIVIIYHGKLPKENLLQISALAEIENNLVHGR